MSLGFWCRIPTFLGGPAGRGQGTSHAWRPASDNEQADFYLLHMTAAFQRKGAHSQKGPSGNKFRGFKAKFPQLPRPWPQRVSTAEPARQLH